MGNTASSGVPGGQTETYDSALRAMRDDDRATESYGARVRSTLQRAADAAVKALPDRERSVLDVHEAVASIHQWLAILGPLCHSCTVASLAKRAADTPTWTDATISAYMQDYVLGACGFVDVQGTWMVDDRVLARLVSSISMWKHLSRSSVAETVALSPRPRNANATTNAPSATVPSQDGSPAAAGTAEPDSAEAQTATQASANETSLGSMYDTEKLSTLQNIKFTWSTEG
jgi:hypothetical protein